MNIKIYNDVKKKKRKKENLRGINVVIMYGKIEKKKVGELQNTKLEEFCSERK